MKTNIFQKMTKKINFLTLFFITKQSWHMQMPGDNPIAKSTVMKQHRKKSYIVFFVYFF